MERSRYSIKPNAGKDLNGLITNLVLQANSTQHGWIQTPI